MTDTIFVTKRDGHREPLDISKISKVLKWAAEDLNVSTSTVELKSRIQFSDGIRTEDIHETLTKTSADLIDRWTPDYQHMAARLATFQIRKKAYGDFPPPHLHVHVKKLVEADWYDPILLQVYTEEDFETFNSAIVHDRDLSFSYAGLKQMIGKYLVRDRSNPDSYPLESPNMAFMVLAMTIFHRYEPAKRKEYVLKTYEALSTGKISFPTPITGGLRTTTKQFSSCTLINVDDSLDSINAASAAIVKYISQRAGIGVNVGRIRAVGSKVRNGEVMHTGLIPFIRLFQSAVKSCSQGRYCPR